MKHDMEKETPRTRNFSRREAFGLIGAAAAASLADGAGTQPASAQTTNAPTRKLKSRVITIDAKPGPIAIDSAKTAVIVVDMQNDFGSKGGMFDRAGIDISMIERVVAPTARVLAAARKAGIPIVYLQMAFQPDLSDMGLRDSPNWRDHQRMSVGTAVRAPNGTQGRILIRNTWNTDIVSDLKPETADTLIYKHRFSGFYETDLDSTLKALGVRYLIFTGCTTSVCVESTIRDAMFRDYSPLLLADCAAEPLGYGMPRSNHEASLFLIETMFGWVSSSEQFINALAAPAPLA